MKNSKRRYFQQWVAKQPAPGWKQLPLTHISKCVTAQDILVENKIEPQKCKVFDELLVYLFYGRAAYRVAGDGAIKLEAACPVCFVFNSDLLAQAVKIYPFDTGAFDARMYKPFLPDEMAIDDFSISDDVELANQLIQKVFGKLESYISGDASKIGPPDTLCEPGDLHARSYLELASSKGRNEPDDRVCSIEALFDKPIELDKHLHAVIVPHTLWNDATKTAWLSGIEKFGAEILTYEFIPGRLPEYYQSQIEAELKSFFRSRSII
ncbi:MAG: hypothetical protein EOP09_10715 [Proteobacteria bacterium]|nr:MAG: hypothetical protein EOP09_10715 [Pseudomonadota bacterium]